jgi:C4-type Zn-finger protein
MVFTDSAATAQTEQTTEQTQQETPPQESYVQKLVEAKGENWKDPEVLAKGKIEADGYIQTLEGQLTQMREDLKKKEYQEEVLEQLQKKATESTAVNNGVPNNNNSNTDGENTTRNISEEDLKSLVEQTLTQREADAVTKTNLQRVDEELDKSFGTNAEEVVKKKAAELGMSMDRLSEIASESPNAFFTLIGEPKPTFNPMVNGSVRTEGVNMQVSTDRNWQYYQKLRRENPNQYYEPKMQQQLLQDRMRLGDNFGN